MGMWTHQLPYYTQGWSGLPDFLSYCITLRDTRSAPEPYTSRCHLYRGLPFSFYPLPILPSKGKKIAEALYNFN